jgi:hypothetical protein
MARIRRSVIQPLTQLLLAGCISLLIFYGVLIRAMHRSAGLIGLPATNNTTINGRLLHGEEPLPVEHLVELATSDRLETVPATLPFDYLPATMLSQRPVILHDIASELPATFHHLTPQRLIFRLLINEYGDVDQVLVEQAALSPDLIAQLQQTFLQARFHPGQLQGRTVRSALRIEITLGSN